MKQLVFLLEEKSAEAMLRAVVSRLNPQEDVTDQYICFAGKSDLDGKLQKRLAGYRVPRAAFIIVRDKDSGDCRAVKAELLDNVPREKSRQSLVRIACHELEAFYLGDLPAVEKGLGINLQKRRNTNKYRDPDSLANAAQELENLTQMRYQKISGSRAIAPHLDLDGRNKSRSFNALIQGIRRQLAYLADL